MIKPVSFSDKKRSRFGGSVPDTNAEYAYICNSYGIERGTI